MSSNYSSVPTSVRFSEETDARLIRLAKAIRTPVKQIIETFVDLGLDRVEEEGAYSIPIRNDPTSEPEKAAREKTIQALSKAQGGVGISTASPGAAAPQKGAAGLHAEEAAQQALHVRIRTSRHKRSSKGKKDSAA